MICFYCITPSGVAVILKKAGRRLTRRVIPTLTGWYLYAASLEAQGVRLIEAPAAR